MPSRPTPCAREHRTVFIFPNCGTNHKRFDKSSSKQKLGLEKMKISAIVSGVCYSVVAGDRQARDTESLFNEMFGDDNNNFGQRNFVFAETDSLFQISQFYLGTLGIRFESHRMELTCGAESCD